MQLFVKWYPGKSGKTGRQAKGSIQEPVKHLRSFLAEILHSL